MTISRHDVPRGTRAILIRDTDGWLEIILDLGRTRLAMPMLRRKEATRLFDRWTPA